MIKFILLFLVVWLFFTSCRSKQEKTKPLQESISESVYASGIVKSKNQYEVFSSANGLIEKIWVVKGGNVKKGDKLIQLVSTSAQLSTENARLSADYASVETNAEKLKEIRISVDIARTRMENDALLLEKQENLWSQNVGTQNDLRQKRLTYQTSANAFHTAGLRYAELQKQIRFLAEQARKNVEISQKLTGDFVIKSNADGKVYDLFPEKGEMVNTLNPVALIGDARDFILELQVDEYDIHRIKPEQKMALSMDSYKGQVFEGAVTKINPAMNRQTKSFTVEARFVRQPPALYPNLTCEANIIIKQKARAITIPRSYLLEGDYILLDKKKKVKVITGLKDYQKVEIISGVTIHDFIFKSTE
jgi:HlyD family secretion protein